MNTAPTASHASSSRATSSGEVRLAATLLFASSEGRRGYWQVKLRWGVPVALAGGALASGLFGFEVAVGPVLVLAACIVLYNVGLAMAYSRTTGESKRDRARDRRLAQIQVTLDYVAMFVLVQLTGGITSPVMYFFVFHIIVAALRFRPLLVYVFSTLACYGIGMIALLQYVDILPYTPVQFRGATLGNAEPASWLVQFLFFVCSVYFVAFMTTHLVSRLRAEVARLQRANEVIEALSAERWQFMMQAAHNTRAPINAALSMLELLGSDLLGPLTPKQEEYLGRVQRRLTALSTSMGELLTTARDREPKLPRVREVVNLHAAASAVMASFGERARNKGVCFDWHVDDCLPRCEQERGFFVELLENLASNAVKYTPAGGRVALAVRYDVATRTVTVSAEDTGIGIPAAEQAKLFSDFFRASNAKRSQEIGTGLGLAIVKRGVERHGGDIHIESVEGVGTTFTVVLPVTPSMAGVSAASAASGGISDASVDASRRG